MSEPEIILLDEVPPPDDLCPKGRIIDYYKIGNDLLKRKILQQGHEKPIGFFCDMLDTHKVFHEKNEKLIKKYGSGRQKRKMQKSLDDTVKLLDQWSRDYFGVDLDHVKSLGVDIPD